MAPVEMDRPCSNSQASKQLRKCWRTGTPLLNSGENRSALNNPNQEDEMAKYGKAAAKSVKSAVHREKRGTLKSGKGGKGGTVKSRKQAIAIGLSEARKKGAKVPSKKS